MRRLMIALLLPVLAAVPALANDSSAELATGGLVFVHNDAVELRTEDLFISEQEIRVRYRFFNTSASDVTTLVAFPMPQIRLQGPDANISVPTQDPQNLLGFSTVAGGKPVSTRVQQKVIANGIDRTELLRRLGVPLAPHLQATYAALDRLPRERWDELVRLGIAEVDEYDPGKGMEKHLEPRWGLETTYYWEQTFLANAGLTIEHRYTPSVGASVETSLGAPGSAKEDWFAARKRKYCLDNDILNTLGRARGTAGTEGTPYSEARIDYVLRTGANWSGPIGDFRVVVDKGDPSNLVSFCGDHVKKIAPSRFEMRKRDFTPDGDFNVLILKRLKAQ